ncbi:AlwI family type II restriction endonuclease [Rossellomorea aquimaris]|uniref:AlwI family type II restriction endonuclease n=1 Tax=Rossellomorea aquimaris TaxID=189382 RepID=UPI001CD3A295|nr:AlwI family type II restriction endonuclease [Rossellomorea aquimaris]MCA1060297.1 AlwI family type II restriction endonuclease [Rossellomorea aquimaris]
MRKVWFITRPERDPKFHVDALRALQSATDDFQTVWSRNRDAHKLYEKVLASEELKRDNISHDGSGGRTWAAMLRTFGYVYTTPLGTLALTKVGEALLNGNKIRENISKQILTLQIPNAYFLESGFRPKFEDDFQIRPARFLVRLVNQPELGYFITKEEITFFALTAKKDVELSLVTEKILEYRKASEKEKDEIKKEVASVYDHRERSDNEARDFASAHGDVAHTFMMLCDYTGLADYVRGDALRVPSEKHKSTSAQLNEVEGRYPFNKRYLISLERYSQNAGLDVDSYKASAFGAIGPATNRSKSIKKVHRLLSSYPVPQSLSVEEIMKVLEQEFSSSEAKKYVSLLKDYKFTSLNEDFVESYVYETDDLVFEDKTAEVLKAIGFEVELRPKPVTDDRTEIEILFHVDDDTIGIMDAKNYKKKFHLSANLASHMASEYIPNYNGYKGKKVSFFGYVTASDWSGERNIGKITDKAQAIDQNLVVQGAIFPVKALLGFLDYCLDNDIAKDERKKIFLSLFINQGYKTVSDMV